MKTIQDAEKTTYLRLAYAFIIIGIVFAIGSIFELSFIYCLWPILTIILGVGFIGIFRKNKQKGVLYLAIGEYIICFSVLALLCNFTSWGIIIYLWPVFITFLGIIFFTIYVLYKRNKFLLFLSLILILLSLFFSILFSYDYNAWWIVFIITGICILISRKN